jgi:hypothetical protein
MTVRRVVGSVAVLAAGLLVLSACSSGKPSGLAPFTPSATSTSSTPTSTSKWTPEQQQVIDGYGRYNELITAILSKTEKIDEAKVHKVAAEPYATTFLKRVDATISAGYVQTGKLIATISAVQVTNEGATIKVCVDQTHTRLTNPSHPAVPKAKTLPPALATLPMVRKGDAWLVAGFHGDEGACTSG